MPAVMPICFLLFGKLTFHFIMLLCAFFSFIDQFLVSLFILFLQIDSIFSGKKYFCFWNLTMV